MILYFNRQSARKRERARERERKRTSIGCGVKVIDGGFYMKIKGTSPHFANQGNEREEPVRYGSTINPLLAKLKRQLVKERRKREIILLCENTKNVRS